jgi:hypothetical protein
MDINEIVKNIKSILFHQVGAASQPSLQHVCAINISGVTRQCTTHNMLAMAPSESGFRKVIFIA